MTAADRDLPPYDPERILAAPFPERVRLVCRSWASQVDPTPFIVIVAYWVKYLVVFIGGWAFFVSFNADYSGFSSGLTSSGGWAFTSTAFQKAILWALF